MRTNSHIVKALVDMAVFLEYADSDLLDEDAAVEAMEQLAAELRLMLEADQQQLAKQIVEFSTSYEQPQSDFVESLPEALGLA
jgi:hypothetical protein